MVLSDQTLKELTVEKDQAMVEKGTLWVERKPSNASEENPSPEPRWTLFVDGSAGKDGVGVGILLVDP
ncbi:hypothetical protein GOBAR_AA37628 [Gossypium barbadense]|uniref:Uncharacterized protein n=2 Tax=Gossypium TaxID=3633 RepID=A0A2P5VW80_GOSBA|nr:hypothetical protein GOBAR_AA37628 [Gossypium barbadense]